MMSDEELKWIKIRHGAMSIQDRDKTLLMAEAIRLREIVSKLPLTADGVPIVPGIKVFASNVGCDMGVECIYKDEVLCHGSGLVQGSDMFDPVELFSTRAAAEAGKDG